jgi:hypothetical protein
MIGPTKPPWSIVPITLVLRNPTLEERFWEEAAVSITTLGSLGVLRHLMTGLSLGVTAGIGKGLRNTWRRYDDIQFLGEDARLTLAQPVKYFDDDNLYSPELKKVRSDQGLLPIEHAELLPKMVPFRDALTKAWLSKG